MMRLLIAVTLALSLPGCQTTEAQAAREQGMCGSGLAGDWTVTSAPADAAALRALGRANTAFPKAPANFASAWEGWYANAEGEVLLCVADDRPKDSCVGEWWAFDHRNGTGQITKSDGWVCVT